MALIFCIISQYVKEWARHANGQKSAAHGEAVRGGETVRGLLHRIEQTDGDDGLFAAFLALIEMGLEGQEDAEEKVGVGLG